MALKIPVPQSQPVFRYQSFHIDKSQPLGRGAYGAVYKAKCDQLPCAAKILHPTILDPTDPGAGSVMQRFQQECALLESIRHSNIVQYLGMTRDPESRLPVLLMELLDESLTKMLEHSRKLLAYCVQVDICHDIALAVVYLHSNDIIHRDLSSNNVLMIAGRRAKVTDFGMSKLAGTAPSMTPLTMCPGTLAYMPPEALMEPPRYTKKLDCFSEGVIMIQVCTRLWPEPGPRTKSVPFPSSPTGMMEVPVLETERRKEHIDMIDSEHSLLPIAMDCLHYQESERPSSEELCQRLAELKSSIQYRESVDRTSRHDDSQLDQLHVELQRRDQLLEEKENQIQPTTGQKMALGKWKSQLRGASFQKVKADSVVIGDVAYFMYIDGSVCAYNSRSKDWKKLPPCPLKCGSLANIRNHLTAIGGSETPFGAPENNLYSLTIADTDKKHPWLWEERFPPMPTKRCCTSSISTKHHLIVAGGTSGRGTSCPLSIVEVMDIETLLWSEAASLPHSFSFASATICGDRLYLLGGVKDNFKTKSVLTCSLKELIRSCSNEEEAPLASSMDSVWHRAADFPVFYSICASIGGELVAVGGVDDFDNTVPAVFKYDPSTDSWSVISNMPTARHDCFVAVLPTNMMMVVGGCKEFTRSLTDKVEIVRIL